MEYLRINPEKPEKNLVARVVDEINKNRVIVYPTDTVYGIGCDIFSKSVKEIYRIKKRSFKNPLSVAFSDLEMAEGFVNLSEEDRVFIDKHIDEPLTFIVRKKLIIPDIVTAGKDTVGLRIPNFKLTKVMISLANVPLISTSANISGEKAPAKIDEISDEVLKNVDLVIDSSICPVGRASTIVDLTEDKKIVRG